MNNDVKLVEAMRRKIGHTMSLQVKNMPGTMEIVPCCAPINAGHDEEFWILLVQRELRMP